MISGFDFLPTDTEFGFPSFDVRVESGSGNRFFREKLLGEVEIQTSFGKA